MVAGTSVRPSTEERRISRIQTNQKHSSSVAFVSPAKLESTVWYQEIEVDDALAFQDTHVKRLGLRKERYSIA